MSLVSDDVLFVSEDELEVDEFLLSFVDDVEFEVEFVDEFVSLSFWTLPRSVVVLFVEDVSSVSF